MWQWLYLQIHLSILTGRDWIGYLLGLEYQSHVHLQLEWVRPEKCHGRYDYRSAIRLVGRRHSVGARGTWLRGTVRLCVLEASLWKPLEARRWMLARVVGADTLSEASL